MASERAKGSQFGGFLFADLRGYTAFVEKRGDAEAVDLLDRYRSMVREVISATAGAEIRTEGDSFYVVFPTASRAVSAGLAIVAEARIRNEADPAAPIRVGVGVHAGETAQTDEGPVGSAVNVAARICAEAAAGEVLVSDTVRGLTRTSGTFAFTSVGARKLKGIDEPMALYRVRSTQDAAMGSAAGRTRRRWIAGAAIVGLIVVVGVVAVAAGSLGGPPNGSTRIVYSRVVPRPGQVGCEDWLDRKLYVLAPDHPDATPHRLTVDSNLYEYAVAASADGATTILSGGAGRHDSGVFAVSPADASVSPIQILSQYWWDAPASVSVSRDGTFAAWVDGDGQVVVGATDGSEMETIPVSEDRLGEFAQSVSVLPDDRLMVVTAVDPESPVDWQIVTVAADGTDRRPTAIAVGDRTVTSLAPSPDGSRAVVGFWSEAEGMPRYKLVPIADGSESELSLPPWAVGPAWSPDGSELVVSIAPPDAEAHLATFNVSSGVVTQLPEEGGTSACSPAWLPAAGSAALPAPTPVPSGAPLTFEIGELLPARYRMGVFQPNMEATFGEAWSAQRNDADLWATGHSDFTTSQFTMTRIQVGLTGPCRADGQVALGDAPTDVVAWLRKRADLTVSDPRAINLGGYTGIEVDVVGVDGKACPNAGEQSDLGPPWSELPYWTLFILGDSWATVFEGERARIATVDVNGRSVSALMFSPADQFDRFIQQVKPVMDSFAFPAP